MGRFADPSTDLVSAFILSTPRLIPLPLPSDPQDQWGKAVADSG